MEIKSMNLEQIDERLEEIRSAMTAEDADIDALTAEVDALEARKAEINEAIEKRAALESRVKAYGKVVKEFKQEEPDKMVEVRNTQAYIDAFAKYIKTGKDAECRALLTENVESGTVPVPEFVEDRVRAAWDRDEIMSRVTRTYLKGNVKVGFEISGTDAVVHVEGTDAPAEETLTLGIVTMVPASIKKWIKISDEVMDMDSNSFLNYIYDELAYKIARAAAKELIDMIEEAPATATATAVGVPVVTASTIEAATVATAAAELSGDASDLVLIMNRRTEAAFKSVQYGGNFAMDIFEGLPRLYSDELAAFSSAASGDTYAIVADLKGAQANFPAGDSIRFKFDDLTLAEADMVKIVGRQYVGIGIVGPGCFVKIAK